MRPLPRLVRLVALLIWSGSLVVSGHIGRAQAAVAFETSLPRPVEHLCAVKHPGDPRTDTMCILLKNRPTTLCLALDDGTAGCPTTENLEPCTSRTIGPKRVEPKRKRTARAVQCATRRFGLV